MIAIYGASAFKLAIEAAGSINGSDVKLALVRQEKQPPRPRLIVMRSKT